MSGVAGPWPVMILYAQRPGGEDRKLSLVPIGR